MKRIMYVGLAMRLFIAAASPAYGAPPPGTDAWKAGNETSTLPWSAPRGHHPILNRVLMVSAGPVNVAVRDLLLGRGDPALQLLDQAQLLLQHPALVGKERAIH